MSDAGSSPIGPLTRQLQSIFGRNSEFPNPPNYSFQDAMEDLVHACNDGKIFLGVEVEEFKARINDCIQEAKKNESRKFGADGVAAILFLSTIFSNDKSFFAILNERLHDLSDIDSFLRYLWMLLLAVGKCPTADLDETKELYRGIKDTVDSTAYRIAEKNARLITWNEISSCSISKAEQEAFIKDSTEGKTLFRIIIDSSCSLRGLRDISSISARMREPTTFLLPPGCQFKVESHSLLDSSGGGLMFSMKLIGILDTNVDFTPPKEEVF